MTKRRKFTPEFKAKVALEALRCDKTIQEIAARHKVHTNAGEHVEAAGAGLRLRCSRTARIMAAGITDPKAVTFTPRSVS